MENSSKRREPPTASRDLGAVPTVGSGERDTLPQSTRRASRDPEALDGSPAACHGAERIRINRFFTQQGICSRREADRLIEERRVTINGRVAVLGDQVSPTDVIGKDGMVLPWGKPPVYLKFHKPVGVTTTTERQIPGNIIAYIGYPERIFPIGRLDKDSSGLILLTNDGGIVNEILRAEHRHEREYLVQVDRPFDTVFLDRMAKGVVLLGKPTRPCRMSRRGVREFGIVLTEGRNRQIRRMCQALGYQVIALHRVRIMTVSIAGLAAGEWAHLTEPERRELFSALRRLAPRPRSQGPR